ncbi:MAG: hypothetical protein AABY11_02960, partial [archaeon]
MGEKPSGLFLSLLAGVGTAVLSPFEVNGMPIALLAIPFAVLAGKWHGIENGIVVGVAGSVIAGVLTQSIGNEGIISMIIGSSLAVWGNEFVGKIKDSEVFIRGGFIVLGVLVMEIVSDILMGESLFLRSESFFGSEPVPALRIGFA